MASFDLILIAEAILEKEVQKYPYSHVRVSAYELQESYESRGQQVPGYMDMHMTIFLSNKRNLYIQLLIS